MSSNNGFGGNNRISALIQSVDAVPSAFTLTPTIRKKPVRPGWNTESLTRAQIKTLLRNGDRVITQKGEMFQRYDGYAILIPAGHVVLDFDGYRSQQLYEQIGADKGGLPTTPSWTSGKEGSGGSYLYKLPEGVKIPSSKIRLTQQIEEEDSEEIINEKNGQAIELLLSGSRATVPPSAHDKTDGYRFIHDWATPIAMAPQWVIDAIAAQQVRPSQDGKLSWTEFTKIFRFPSRNTIPLEICLSRKSRDLLQHGSSQGTRSDDAIALALDLVGTADYLGSNGQRFSGDAERYFYEFCDRCTPPMSRNDAASTWKSAQQRANGASLSPEQVETCVMSYEWKNNLSSYQPEAAMEAKPIETSVISSVQEEAVGPVGSEEKVGSGAPTYETCLQQALDETVGSVGSVLEVGMISKVIRLILVNEDDPWARKRAKIQLRKRSELREREFADLWQSVEEELAAEERMMDAAAEIESLLKSRSANLTLSDYLPRVVADPISLIAKWQNLRPECYLLGLLTCVSSLHKNGTKLILHKALNFKVSPNIFGAIVAESSQKKSPIIRTIAVEPMRVLNAEAAAKHKKEMEAHEEIVKNLKDGEKAPLEPALKIHYFTKTTGEAILRQASRVPDAGLLQISDELAGALKSANQYRGGKGSDQEDMLEYYDGTGGVVLRSDGVRDNVEALNLSLFGGFQPRVVEHLLGNCEDSNGNWSRYFFVQQPTAASSLPDDDGWGIDICDMLAGHYRRISNYPVQDYTLAPDAFKYFQAAYNRLEKLREQETNPALRAVWGKSSGRIGKLALNLHVYHHAVNNPDGSLPSTQVPKWAIVQATKLAHFAAEQIRSIYSGCDGDKPSGSLTKVIELSKRKGWVKAKDVQLSFSKQSRPTPDTVRQWFRQLEGMGLGQTEGTGNSLKFNAVPKEPTEPTFSTDACPDYVSEVNPPSLPISEAPTEPTVSVEMVEDLPNELSMGDFEPVEQPQQPIAPSTSTQQTNPTPTPNPSIGRINPETSDRPSTHAPALTEAAAASNGHKTTEYTWDIPDYGF